MKRRDQFGAILAGIAVSVFQGTGKPQIRLLQAPAAEPGCKSVSACRAFAAVNRK